METLRFHCHRSHILLIGYNDVVVRVTLFKIPSDLQAGCVLYTAEKVRTSGVRIKMANFANVARKRQPQHT